MRALDSSICRPIRVHAWFWNGAQGVDALVRELGARRAALEQVLQIIRPAAFENRTNPRARLEFPLRICDLETMHD